MPTYVHTDKPVKSQSGLHFAAAVVSQACCKRLTIFGTEESLSYLNQSVNSTSAKKGDAILCLVSSLDTMIIVPVYRYDTIQHRSD